MKTGENHEILLEVNDLTKYFPITGGLIPRVIANLKAVDGVSFKLKAGETLGIVGESGCGKSTLGRIILRLLEPTSGEVIYRNESVCGVNSCSLNEFRKLRSNMQIIFQDPYASLNPRMKVGSILSEPLRIHKACPAPERREKVEKLVDLVGLNTYHLEKYPHEFSGGQQQRIGIARALALNPDLIICDEPVSALDVSIQSQILNLLKDLQGQLGLTYMFISHDLSVVKHISDTVGVMYLGKILEIAPVKELFSNPLHPYTEALLSAIPVPNPRANRKRIILHGDVPSPINLPSGCRFQSRCPQRMDICTEAEPALVEVAAGHQSACFLHKPLEQH
jgi:oligopeptide transport system ATP-binding protein